MEQHKFIFMAHTIGGELKQDPDGNTTHYLRDNLSIVHNYKRNSLVMNISEEPKVECVIPGIVELEMIYKLHLEHTDVFEALRRYATEWSSDKGGR